MWKGISVLVFAALVTGCQSLADIRETEINKSIADLQLRLFKSQMACYDLSPAQVESCVAGYDAIGRRLEKAGEKASYRPPVITVIPIPGSTSYNTPPLSRLYDGVLAPPVGCVGPDSCLDPYSGYSITPLPGSGYILHNP